MSFIAVLGIWAVQATAATIDSSQYFALVNPGDPSSPTVDTAELNDILANYYPQRNGTYSVTDPAWGNSTTYAITINYLGSLPTSATLSGGGSASGTTFTLDLGSSTYDFLMVKWDNRDVFYDLRGESGELTIVNDLVSNSNGQLQGVSHYQLFNESGNNVPDGGSTMVLLGSALSGFALIRRKLG